VCLQVLPRLRVQFYHYRHLLETVEVTQTAQMCHLNWSLGMTCNRTIICDYPYYPKEYTYCKLMLGLQKVKWAMGQYETILQCVVSYFSIILRSYDYNIRAEMLLPVNLCLVTYFKTKW